jgi:hypothetical protein
VPDFDAVRYCWSKFIAATFEGRPPAGVRRCCLALTSLLRPAEEANSGLVDSCSSGCFSLPQRVGSWGSDAAVYLPVRGGASVGTECQESLESGHWFATPVVSEHKLVEVDLKLRAAYAMVRSDEPVLKIADCPVRKGRRTWRPVAGEERVAGFAGGACIRPLQIPRSS